jgi:hypothetical protein
VRKAFKDHKDPRAYRDHKDLKAYRDHKDPRAYRDLKELPDLQDHKGHREFKVLEEFKGRKGRKVLLDHKVRQDRRAHKVLKELAYPWVVGQDRFLPKLTQLITILSGLINQLHLLLQQQIYHGDLQVRFLFNTDRP